MAGEAQRQATSCLNSGSAEILKFLAQHKDLYALFYENKQVDRSSDSYVPAMLAAEMIATFAELIFRQAKHFTANELKAVWISYAKWLCDNPTVRAHVREHPGWYSRELKKATALD